MRATFLPYPGGKGKLASHIIAEINRHKFTEYREPFLGGGAIGVHYAIESHVDCWLNDIDIGIYSLWDSVANHHDELIEKVRDFVPSVDRFASLKEFFRLPITADNPVEIGFNKLVLHKLSFSGLGERGSVCGGQGQAKFNVRHRWSPEYIARKIEYVHDCFAWRQPTISRIDYSEMIKAGAGSSSVMIYLDPPYYNQGPGVYRHFFEDPDHVKLSKLLQKTNHNWVLSYDDHWRIRDLYHWADIKVLYVQYSIANHVGGHAAKREELLITPKKRTVH